MVKNVYAIYDKKCQVFGSLMLFHNDGHALRDLRAELQKNPQSVMVVFGGDYEVHCVGTYNDSDGFIKREVPVRLVSRLDQLMGDRGSPQSKPPKAAGDGK